MTDPASQPLAPDTRGDTGVKVVGGSGSSQPSLLKALVGTFGSTLLASALFKLGNDILTFVSPQLLR